MVCQCTGYHRAERIGSASYRHGDAQEVNNVRGEEMIDMSDIITDPDFMETFTVYRKTGTFGEGGYTTTEVAIDMAGPVIPANPDELAMVPEGDRLTGNNV